MRGDRNMTWLNILLGILTVLGVIGTFYFGLRARSLRWEMRRFTWSDIHMAARNQITEAIEKFQPEMIVTMAGPGAIVPNIAMRETKEYLPIFTIWVRHPAAPEFLIEPLNHHKVLTSRWIYYVPKFIFSYTDRRILLFDDCVVTGDTLQKIVDLLVEKGFSRDNILTSALVTTEIALDSGKAPDIYTYVVPDGNFYMPWGRSLGRGYNRTHVA
jgi:hypoxanthine phosphoribosyltransferase